MDLYFSDFFKVPSETVEDYGAFDVSLVSDLPLFIDPFLLFNSKKPEYRKLHNEIIKYLSFLKDKATNQSLSPGLIGAWYRFPEISQNWLGFSVADNKGRGLGQGFARSLHTNLHRLFTDFGKEKITRSSHLEKLCLIEEGVGKDNISDFTTNLIHEFLLKYTQAFARKHIKKKFRNKVTVEKVRFNYETETWERRVFDLPSHQGGYVLLTPRDMLTKDDTWINKSDLLDDFHDIPDAIPNEQLRAQINNYFRKVLPKKPTKKDERAAAIRTIWQFPQLIDFYIKYKEDNERQATRISARRVKFSEQLYVNQFKQLVQLLETSSDFYALVGDTYEEARQRALFLKDVIENKGGHKLFYIKGHPVARESDLHILYRLTWFATPSDVSREVNDGRGPADFKISRGSGDKSLVEFKLARNTQLARNLQRQSKVYQKASDATQTIKVIVFFTKQERARVEKILSDLKLTRNPHIVLVDARRDNKPSGSKA